MGYWQLVVGVPEQTQVIKKFGKLQSSENENFLSSDFSPLTIKTKRKQTHNLINSS